MRVLIVEDEVELGRVFHDYLAAVGHRPEVVGSAEAALDRLAAGPPHVIVLDVKLPGMSGVDFLRLRAVRESGIPVIVVSGHATEPQARECLRLGALEFLAKPVPLDVLATVLQYAAVFAGSGDRRRRERRGAGRIVTMLPVRVLTEDGRTITGRVIDASVTGLRAQLNADLRVGSLVRLHIALADGAPLETPALVIRADTGGTAAVWFLDLAPAAADRLLAATT
jgi:CheY-like chemotaxis protein